MFHQTLTQEQLLYCLERESTLALFSQIPLCTCYLFYQFYQCGCPDLQSRDAVSLFGQPLRFRQPYHFPSRYRCPVSRLPVLAQQLLHARGFRHKYEPYLPYSPVPVELPFPCYQHKEACLYTITKKELKRRKCYVRTAGGGTNCKVAKTKRRGKVKREVEWAEKQKKALREFIEVNTSLTTPGQPKVIHDLDKKFIETWDRIVEPPVHVKFETQDWFHEEQKRDLLKDDAANGSKVADRMYPEIGLLGRGKYELGATVLDVNLINTIAKKQWDCRGYPYENVQRFGNSGANVFQAWNME